MAENPYAWDYDYKKHYFEAFEKFEKEGDGNDSIGRFLAYKSTGDAFSTEPECIGSSKDVLSDALSLPDSDGDAWEKARGEDKLEKGSMSLLIGYDAMNSFATTFNCSLHVLYPDDFNDYRIKRKEKDPCKRCASWREGLAFFEEHAQRPPRAKGTDDLWKQLEWFAKLAHTIGNFTFIPYIKPSKGTTFNSGRGYYGLPHVGQSGQTGQVYDYWDLSLEWLKKHWGSYAVEEIPIEFEEYVELARLEFYCVGNKAVEKFLDEARESTSPASVIEEYKELREEAEEGGCSVESFWTGHKLDDPDSYLHRDEDSSHQIAEFLNAVNMRIEARGRLLIALHALHESKRR